MKTYFDKNDRLNDVVIIRSLAIIMVVAFHAYYMMFVPGHFPRSMGMYRGLYYNINNLILQFRMPLFILISGYLFSHLENDKGKYKGFKNLLTNKFRRLIIPFFVFATVFMLTVNNFSLEPYYRWGYSHLWFIPMLFWCFVFTRLQSFLPFSNTIGWKYFLMITFFCLNIYLKLNIPLFAIPNFLKWYFWFYFGYQLYLYRDTVYDYINRNKIIFSCLFITCYGVAIYLKCNLLKDENVKTWYTELGNISISLFIWYWVNWLLFNIQNFKWMKQLNWLNKHSYGIYVFHNWLQPFMISSTAIALFGLDALAIKYPVIFPFSFFVTSFALSLFLTYVLLKTRIGRFLLG